MKSGRLLSAIVLALCSTFTLSSFQQAPSALPSAPQQEGKAMGVWKSPKPGQLGHAAGVLGENGGPAYFVELRVKPALNGGIPNGSILGRLIVPGSGKQGSKKKVVANVVGKWRNKPGQPGSFRGVLVRKNPVTGKTKVIGVLRGKFVDPPMKPGSFNGEWAIF